MSLSLLQRSIACLQGGKPLPEPVRDYILSVLDARHRRPRRTGVQFEPIFSPAKKLKKELDRLFSLFIRQRDSDPDTGIGRCVTCGVPRHWREMDCGHYCPRQDLNTRWDEKNCALQCGRCNGFRGGEAEKFAEAIDKRYGNGTAELLRAKSKMKVKMDRHKLQIWIDHYKKLVREP